MGSILASNGEFMRFFNPRRDKWFRHFSLEGAFIKAITDIGEVTASILQFNSSERILEREILIALGRYPSRAAITRMLHEG